MKFYKKIYEIKKTFDEILRKYWRNLEKNSVKFWKKLAKFSA